MNLTNLTNLRPRESFLLCIGNIDNPINGPANAPAICAAQPTLPHPNNAGTGSDIISAPARSNTARRRQPA